MNELEAAIPGVAGRAGYGSRQRLAIVAAVSLLVLIMLGVAFSAGVYIGNNRELAPGTLPGTGAQPRPGQPAPGGAAPGPNGQAAANPFDVAGPVQAAGAGSLTLAGPGGGRTVVIDARTRFMRPDGTAAASRDVQPGSSVGIKVRAGSNPPAADTVTLLPPIANPPMPAGN